MKFEVGDRVRVTTTGHKGRVICNDAEGIGPLIVLIEPREIGGDEPLSFNPILITTDEHLVHDRRTRTIKFLAWVVNGRLGWTVEGVTPMTGSNREIPLDQMLRVPSADRIEHVEIEKVRLSDYES